MLASSSNLRQPAARSGEEEVLSPVDALVPILRRRAAETEKLRRMHPDTLRDLTDASVLQLSVPTDVGSDEADDALVIDTLVKVARRCLSTGWICSIITAANTLSAPM